MIAFLLAFRQYGILWAALFFVLFAVSFVFLMAGAGHRTADDEIHLRIWDKIPLGIYMVIVGAVEFAGMMLCLVIGYDMIDHLEFLVVLLVVLLAGMAYLALAFLMSVAVRIKAGVFWKNTLLVICGKKLLGLLGKIRNRLCVIACAAREHTSLFRKTIVILIAVFFADLILIWIWSERGYRHFYFGVIVWLVAVSVLKGGVVIWAVLQMARLQEGSRRVAEGDNSTPIDTQGMFWEFKKHAENINKIGDGIAIAVEQQMKSERFKTELITNVSHDIKTPLTSIINYVDLIKKEKITNPVVTEYIEVLDRQSARLKKLIEDLMEASKASTGNLPVNLEKCDAAVFLSQAVGEFQERAEASQLTLIVTTPPEPVEIMADGRHLWRVFDNLLNNICKYAQPGTRVYISLEEKEGKAVITFKNISRYQLNISSEELMERFVRGDSSRNTEGSGLGLSIAQSLTNLMNGTMELSVDGDLFKVTLTY
jgi:signal transduction histidine kinase